MTFRTREWPIVTYPQSQQPVDTLYKVVVMARGGGLCKAHYLVCNGSL